MFGGEQINKLTTQVSYTIVKSRSKLLINQLKMNDLLNLKE